MFKRTTRFLWIENKGESVLLFYWATPISHASHSSSFQKWVDYYKISLGRKNPLNLGDLLRGLFSRTFQNPHARLRCHGFYGLKNIGKLVAKLKGPDGLMTEYTCHLLFTISVIIGPPFISWRFGTSPWY